MHTGERQLTMCEMLRCKFKLQHTVTLPKPPKPLESRIVLSVDTNSKSPQAKKQQDNDYALEMPDCELNKSHA